MPGSTIAPAPRVPLADLSVNSEPLSRSDDPLVRGPLLLASAGRGATDATFQIAAAVAGRLNVGVEIAAALEPYPATLFEAVAPYPRDLDSIQRDIIVRGIERRRAGVGAPAIGWPVTIYYGDPARVITTVARECDATMIIVGLGKHDPINRLPGGERALHVLRGASCPVLAVAPDAIALPTKAVVGMDFSPASVRAARAALQIIAENGRCILVHVQPIINLLPFYATSENSSESYETLLDKWRMKSARSTVALFTRLREELQPYAPRGVTIETRTTAGVVAQQLIEVAEETKAQVIAVGTHGPSVVERLFVGSVATEVLRHAHRTVLAAPAPTPAESARLTLRLQGTVQIVRPDDWAIVLERFSARNAGRRARLEVNDPELGAQVQQSGFALIGVTYDHHDRRVEVMFGDPLHRTCHLTHSVPRVDDVSVVAEPGGPERTLRILSGHAQTLVTFLD